MNCVIRTQNLSKKFRRVNALTSLNLEVPEGSIYALVGPNGAGKTTAIKTLMNILCIKCFSLASLFLNLFFPLHSASIAWSALSLFFEDCQSLTMLDKMGFENKYAHQSDFHPR
jgi:ABC-type antimicrobial peptide transport system ATPase subunit